MKHPWLTSIVVATTICAGAGRLPAIDVDMSLNLLYDDPMDSQSDGNWQLVAKMIGFDERGLAAADVLLADLFFTPEFHAPQAEVGGTTVGFEVDELVDFGSHRELVMSQIPQDDGVTQPLFYDVGVLGGGTQPGDAGPGFTLDPETERNIPWGMADPLMETGWDGAVLLASGIFNDGLVPSFFSSGPNSTRALVFTSVGNEATPGIIAEASVTTVRRDNLVDEPPPGLDGDYNDNDRVEQQDLDLVLLNWGQPFDSLPPEWMNQRPMMGIVDQAELDGVLLNWGSVPAAGLGNTAQGVPEPSTLVLAALAAALGWRFLAARRVVGVTE